MKFTIECEMKDRWVPHFLAMLHYMQILGDAGCSRKVTLYADGDGDFRPKFIWDKNLPYSVEPVADYHGDRMYDAG